MRIGHWSARLALLATFLTAIPVVPQAGPLVAQAQTSPESEAPKTGLQIRLSEGAPPSGTPTPSPAPAPRVSAIKMSDAATRELLSRLPPLPAEPVEVQPVRLHDGLFPPPPVGQIIAAAFAPPKQQLPADPPPVDNFNTPLEVLRYSPEGEVKIAPVLSITFSLPMVDLSSQGEAAAHVPVTLTPQPTGKWRWLGTQTLVFQPEAEGGRFPMATEYTVTIPAGIRSATGKPLAKATTFSFSTPPPRIVESHPDSNNNARDPLMFMQFDQRIDATTALANLKLIPAVPGVHLRAATSDEIAADESVKDLVKQAPAGRWLAFRAVDANGGTANVLPADTQIIVSVTGGATSAEGPRIVTESSSMSFKTYAAPKVTGTNCTTQSPCSPFDSFSLSLNNSIDQDSFRPTMVDVSPAIPDMKVSIGYNTISIDGVKQANTKYMVKIGPEFRDSYGQPRAGSDRFEFNVVPARAQLFSTNERFIVLDPALRPTFNVYSINYDRFRVKLFQVEPEDWQAYRRYQASFRPSAYDRAPLERNKRPLPPPGTLVFENEVAVKGAPDQLIETAIDLSPALTNGHGQVFVQVMPVEGPNAPVKVYAYRPNGNIEAWVQATDISLDAFADNLGLTVSANSLADGKPLPGVELSLAPNGLTGATDANGLARFAFDQKVPPNVKDEAALLVARRGDDVAIFPESYSKHYSNDAGHWSRTDDREAIAWHVFDDRGLYRPGEEVSVKGWIRRIDLSPHGDTELPSTAGESVTYVLEDDQYNEVTKGNTTLNALGGFDLKLRLPLGMNLGNAWLRFKRASQANKANEFSHGFQVQEFRRPEFELKPEWSPGPDFVGSAATATVNASYYAGGGLADANVEWKVTSRPINYTPPNRDDFIFGKFQPWWLSEAYPETTEQNFAGKTDAQGRHTLRMEFGSVNPVRPTFVRADATVTDVNRQTVSTAIGYLVHPSSLYVGIKSARAFVQAGQDLAFSGIVTDIDGKAVAGREIKLRLARLETVKENGEWVDHEVEAREQTVRSGNEAAPFRFTTAKGGTYRLTAQVRDDHERLNETEMELWVAGGEFFVRSGDDEPNVNLIPDRRTYAAGDTAEVLVQSPLGPAEGVLTIRRSGVLRTEHFSMTGSTYTLRIPIEDAMTPNVHIQVDLTGNRARKDDAGKVRTDLPKRIVTAKGELDLAIPPVGRRLKVTATPRERELAPGQETTVDILVQDARGNGVAGTDTAVVVVDESVLALTGFKVADPLTSLYPERAANVSDYHLRRQVKVASALEAERLDRRGNNVPSASGEASQFPIDGRDYAKLFQQAQFLRMLGSATGVYSMLNTSGTNVSTEYGTGIDLRKNFNALALFAASVPTDARGRAQVRVKLPDNLSRYRVIAVSVAGGKLAGTGESSITARKQLMARPSAPRFLNFGDHAELPVVVQNQTAKSMTVDVTVRATNAELTDGAGRTVTIPANDRVEVRFPVAARSAGVARFQIVTAAGKLTDAAEISLPVYTPATTEDAATYGILDQGSIAQPVKAPAGVLKEYGGLEVTTASTQLQELTDALVYLIRYPYECSEQISSRIMAIAAVKDVMTAFKSKDLPAPEALTAFVDTDIKRLHGLQNEDGGFDFWTHGRPSVPYVSVHVAHALVIAKEKGFNVPDEMLDDSKLYLKDIEIPNDYSPSSQYAIRAYAVYVRNLMHDPDLKEARAIVNEAGGVENLSLESLGWLLPVLSKDPASAEQVAAIRRVLNNRVTETAGAARFVDSYSDGAFTMLSSGRRTDGVLLNALIGDQPQSDLIPKLVRGLLDARRGGRWVNTQENVFVLLALDRYFHTFEKTEPNFTARVWLGNDFAGEQTFQGRSVDKQQLNLPMAQLVDRTATGAANLVIDKQGDGRLYYRIATRFAPSDLNLAAADYGFKVERTYEAVDDPADVRRDPDGTWHIKAGARIRVRLKMSNPAQRYHVALVDPLPAGLEAINPELAGNQPVPDDDADDDSDSRSSYWYWRGTWFDHQNLRDDRVEAFTQMLWAGEHAYSYLARATTPGMFIVPPPKAEEMYAPETFGRGHSDRVKIE